MNAVSRPLPLSEMVVIVRAQYSKSCFMRSKQNSSHRAIMFLSVGSFPLTFLMYSSVPNVESISSFRLPNIVAGKFSLSTGNPFISTHCRTTDAHPSPVTGL